MSIEPIFGEIFRYYVDGYLIDLRAHWGIGFCGCPDFEFRRQSLLANFNRKPKHADDFRCKHLRIARRELALELLDRILCMHGKLKEL